MVLARYHDGSGSETARTVRYRSSSCLRKPKVINITETLAKTGIGPELAALAAELNLRETEAKDQGHMITNRAIYYICLYKRKEHVVSMSLSQVHGARMCMS